jgi:D-serine deaminase-like pyridoxal phosphate-dependent protein
MGGSVGVVGATKHSLDTPALLVDLDVLDGNIARMASTIGRHGVGWRPHIKGIKTPAIAHKLLAAGAIGVTCATLREAEIMSASGVRSILICNQIADPGKMVRLAGLSRHAEVIIAVDDARNVAALAEAAQAAGAIIHVVIEVDSGMKRAGVAPGVPTVEFAKVIAAEKTLRFRGLASWEGHTPEIAGDEAKEQAVRMAVGLVVAAAADCRNAGLDVDIVSCGGTGTYWITAAIPGVTEIQAGGGIFGDMRYLRKYRVDHACALTVLSRVISRPTPRRIVCDAGRKAMSVDQALPEPILDGRVAAMRFSAEHTTIELDTCAATPAVGETLSFRTGYSDTTVFLHEEMFAMRRDRVEIVWDILARDRL